MIEWCSEKWLFNQLSSEQTIYCQILHTVWYISGERLKEKIEVDHSWEDGLLSELFVFFPQALWSRGESFQKEDQTLRESSGAGVVL